MKKRKKKRYSVTYKTVTVHFNKNPRTGICECCEKKFKTHLHHWKYVYKPKEVKKNPELALKNTSELCYSCHKLGNALYHVNNPINKRKIDKLKKLKID